MHSKNASGLFLRRARTLAVVCGGLWALVAAQFPALPRASAAREAREKETALAAPITGVTVYSDRARVVRSTRLQLEPSVRQRFVLPLLSTSIDASSIRIDARPAPGGNDVDVERVEIALVEGSELPVTETQRLLDELDQLDVELGRLSEENSAYQSHLDLLGRLTPAAPPTPSMFGGGKPATLNPAGWGTVFQFLRGTMEKLHSAQFDNAEKSRQLSKKRDQLLAEVRLLGGAQQRSAYRVTATLHGHGSAVLWLSYVTPSARWLPTYDIQLLPGKNQVELGFSGQVSQETGEDWTDVALMLSTAVPSLATQAPKLYTWKLGSRERFIPTPPPVHERPPQPPPPLSPSNEVSPTALLRRRLLARAGMAPSGRVTMVHDEEGDSDRDGIPDSADLLPLEKDTKEKETTKSGKKRPVMKAEAPPPAPPSEQPAPIRAQMLRRAESAPSADTSIVAEEMRVSGGLAFGGDARSFEPTSGLVAGNMGPRGPVLGVGLAPPPAYRPPPLDANSPAALAGGYDLSYQSLYKETIASGKGARRVALFSRSFPVAVQRKVFAALAKEAYLVAEINNPSKQPLPGGQAQLFVGADPAGVATLQLVAPGEAFTLPLGLDRALKPVRNVRLTTVEKGVFSKDEISEYVVTTELVNPHRQAIDVRILDQLPLPGDKNVEIKLVSSEPPATPDRDTGALQWRLTVPPAGKVETRFTYTLRRPKGARLYQ
jgi:hypothetical protein